MDILKAATDWAKDELFSTPFFALFGLGFMVASFAFWQLGKTDIARAYIIPTLIAGALLVTIGLGLFFTNKSRVKAFEKAYHADKTAFVKSEIERADSTLKEYQTIVFKAIPIIIATCAIGIIFLDNPKWRASLITTIAMLIVILLIDGTAHARINNYKNQLETVKI
ncbi:hypothetical protein [Winogradskyella endarachnes]|uniref:Uncharacterized protein n=1 Tax=Winogradskyella endarachnes TaxID=2681965 RepID=A0A6L6UBN9_9FLAO|nr:hypothetical protein [Winogradskyella endarachnes]MUU78946.1 hypothetical protein [Winogradskyella endarachnes]